jgi:hypothetical protein
MVSSYSTDLKLELMVTGENAGTWGDITNTNLVILQQAIAGYGTVALNATTGATLTFSNGALSDGKNAVIELTGTITGNVSVIVPDGIEKTYLVKNNTTGAFTVQIKTTSGTGPTFATTDKGIKLVYSNGTDVIDSALQKLSSDYAPQLSANLDANGQNILIDNGNFIGDENGNEQIKFVTTASATNEVTVTNAAAGNKPSISATGGDTNVGLNITPKGIGRVTANGNAKIFGVAEGITITTTFQTTLNYNTNTQAVYYSNVAAASNFTVNLRGDGSNSLNSSMETGESLTVALLSKQNNTTYYNNVIQVDGTTVTAIWQGGSAPTSGNASSTDVYTYTAIKTAASTFTVLASQIQFK